MPLGRDRPARDHKADQTGDENSQNSFPGERPLNTEYLVTLARPLLNAERTAAPDNGTSTVDPKRSSMRMKI